MARTGFKQDGRGYWIEVSPSAVLDYAEDWADWIGADTIASVTWAVPAGLTITAQANTTTKATVWLSGFVLGSTYEVSCRITTAAGRVDTRVFRLVCRKR